MNKLAADKLTALLLVGGLGTRLRSVLPDLPKPMAPVGGRPFLEVLIAQLARAGFQEVVLCVGYRSEAIEAHFGNGNAHGVRIRYAQEQELLGTAGAVLQALPLIRSDPFLVMNGDSYCALDFAQLLARHEQQRGSATLAAVQVADASRYGSLQIDAADHVLGFNEKGQMHESGWINAGIYVLARSALDGLSAGPASLERTVFPSLAARHGLFAFKTEAAFIDIGIPADLARAESVLLSDRTPSGY